MTWAEAVNPPIDDPDFPRRQALEAERTSGPIAAVLDDLPGRRIAMAHWYIRQGFGVFSVWGTDTDGECRCSAGTTCTSAGKHPIPPVGFKAATMDPERITVMLSAASQPNLGVIVPDACFGWDLDGEDAERIAALEAVIGTLPPTMGHQTPNGRHVIYRWPDGIDRPDGKVLGVVTRWRETGYLVGAGSRIGEREYRLLRGTDGQPLPIAGFPPAWVARAASGERRMTVGNGHDPAARIGGGHRHDFLRDQARLFRGRGLTGGPLFDAVWALNEARCDPPKTREEVERAIGAVESRFATDLAPRADHRVRTRQVVVMASVKPERVSWTWRGYIPDGKLTIAEGDPGLGKSTIALDLAARISRGAPMPDGSPGPAAAGVVILSAEDGLADTIRPRLEAAGADLDKVVALTAILDGGERLPSLPVDLDEIEATVIDHDAALVIIDPLMAYLAADVNSHRDQDVRRTLAPLSALAERTGAAVLVVRHLNKGSGPALYRGGGSIGIIGAARAALLVAPDPEDETRRILAVSKSNLGPLPSALAYRVEGDPATGAARIVWEGATDHTASALLATPVDDEERSAVGDAVEVLRTILSEGPVPAREAEREALSAGVSPATLRRARQAVGVVTQKVGRPGETTQRWEWSLAPKMLIETRRRSTPEGEHLRENVSIFEDGPDLITAARSIFGDDIETIDGQPA